MTGGEASQRLAIELAHVFGVVGVRSYRHVHYLTVRREHDVTRVMAARREMRHDGLGGAACGQVAVAVGKAKHGIGVADIDPLRIGSRRIEADAERIGQAGRKYRRLCRFAAIRPQHADASGAALGDENVAVRGGAHQCAGLPGPRQKG